MADARATESVAADAATGDLGADSEVCPVTLARNDRFWARYKVPWKFHETPEPCEETKMKLKSLGLWTPGDSAQRENATSVVREDQRQEAKGKG